MTRKDLIRNYWRYYLMLERKFLETTNYIEIDTRNFSTFSNEYALLLQSVGAELDIFFKAFCEFNLTDRKNINDYASEILNNKFPKITTEKLTVIGTNIDISPFNKWNASAAAQSLTWWLAFDNIKHNRNANLTAANLKNVLNALAGLYLLEVKMFTKATKDDPSKGFAEIDIPTDLSSLFDLPKWNYRCISMKDFMAIPVYQ